MVTLKELTWYLNKDIGVNHYYFYFASFSRNVTLKKKMLNVHFIKCCFFLHKSDDGQQQQRQEPKIHPTDCKNSMLLKTDLYGFFTSIYHLSLYVNMVYNMMQSRKKR